MSSRVSSILKKTSLKTTLNQIKSPAKVRFILPHSKKVQIILREYIKRTNIREYENLVCLIRDSELFDEDISALLKEATECISLLNLDLKLFIEALLALNWNERSDSVVTEYQSFIVNLISAHNYHAGFVINKLISLFLPSDTDTEWEEGEPGKDIKKCLHIHSVLGILLTIVPMCKDLIVNSLINHFPYVKKSTHTHEFYIHNLLWIIDYQPLLRPQILNLIFSRLVIMDVHAPKEEIEKLLYENDEIFEMDDSKSILTTTTSVPNISGTAHTLDICLNKLFKYFINECHNMKTGQLLWNKTKSLYQDMLVVFDQIILPTYNTHHVQFIMFVLCSFKSTITDAFLNFLWKKVCNPNVPPVLRQAAANYIASLLARATFVSVTAVKFVLKQMSDWIHSYISNQDGLECVNSDVRIHLVFYTVCQALFYVIAFRQKDFVRKKKNMIFLESLNLSKIVACRLNPLRVCQSAVVQNFSSFTRNYQLAYCFTIIEHNSRNILPTIHTDDKGSILMTNNTLSVYYPFDPFILSKSSDKIHPYYRNYEETEENNSVEMRDLEVDDFLENPDNCSPPQKSMKFSYGTSPGFKFKS